MKRLLCGLLVLWLPIGVTGQAKVEYVITTLDVRGAKSTSARAINDSGEIVGYYDAGGTTHCFLLSKGNYLTLDVPGSTFTYARAINNLGQIGGDYEAGGIRHGFLRSGAITPSPLDPLGSTNTRVLGISNSGQIVGDYSTGGARRGFLRSAGGYTTILVPGSTATEALAINASGQIVGNYDDASGKRHGFLRLSDGGYAPALDVAGATLTAAAGINDSGEIVGRYRDARGTFHGFLLSGGSYTTVDPPGSTETFAGGINASGQIVGFYVDAGGTTHGFLATPAGQAKNTRATTNDKAEQEIRQVEDRRREALVRGDSTTLDQLFADELIHTTQFGEVRTKAQILSDLKSGALKVDSLDEDDVTVRIYGRAAVVTGRAIPKVKGRQISGQVRFTRVYVKRQGRWQIVAHQVTRIAQQ